MAIDSAIKRASMANEFMLVRMPNPDGAMGMADRSTFNWLYAGLDYTPPPPGVAPPQMVFNLGRPHVIREFAFKYRIVPIWNTRVWAWLLPTH